MSQDKVRKLHLSEVPLLIRIAIVLTLFNTWVLFAEFVIDRYGLWPYMPLYRVAHPCIWDVVALAGAILIVWLASRRRPDRPMISSPRSLE